MTIPTVRKKLNREERLYSLPCNTYVQYNGVDDMPLELSAYIQNNRGEYPPFMYLPSRAVAFRSENGGTIQWPGKGDLPAAVMSFVKENGFLPRYNDDAVDDLDDLDDKDDFDETDWDESDNEEPEEWTN